jgi:2-isopropylmalate synthase/UPF0716 protein FxsA
MKYFLILFFLEIFVTIEVGAYLGGFMTILEIIASFILGVILLQSLKMSFIETIISMSKNRSDMSSMMVGSILSFIGCILLMVPGILSDFIGILLQISVLDTLVLKIFMKNKKQKKYEDENIIDIEIEDDFQIRK